MSQKAAWEKEYATQKLMTLGDEPQADVLRFLKWFKKEKTVNFDQLNVLDLGCGTGRNANYLAGLGAKVTGYDIAGNVLQLAKDRAKLQCLTVDYFERNIGKEWPLAENSIDLIIDITSSNSLNEAERIVYLSEMFRVLKSKGYIFVRALCKDGDKNAKFLIKEHPGKEKDTYILPGVNIVERVFTESDFRQVYGQDFKIIKLQKKTGYQRFNNQSYKRNYWLAYLVKK